MTKSKKSNAVATKRDATEAEIAAGAMARDRVKARPVRPEPNLETKPGAVASISAKHADENTLTWLMMDALATGSNDFVSAQIKAMVNTTSSLSGASSQELGSAFAFVAAVEPRNEMEAALAVQMYAAHSLAIEMLTRAKVTNDRRAMSEYGNLATKAQRTFTAQIDALTKLRSGGKQIVEHRHIYVDNRGGQAIVADHVSTGGPGHGRQFENQSHALGASLFGADAPGQAVPGTKGEGSEAVPDARS